MRPLVSLVKIAAALTYSSLIGYLVAALFLTVFRVILPPGIAFGAGALLGIRVAALFASMTSAATLNWRSIWLGTGCGMAVLMAAWPAHLDAALTPPRVLYILMLAPAATVIATATTFRSPFTSHPYHSAWFARLLHSIQGVVLFAGALPAALFWPWSRPAAVGVTVSALLLWKVWDGACPVTLTENAARLREGRPLMPPDSGFIPDVFAHAGISISGQAVTVALYAIGCSLCGWIGITWVL